MKTIHLLVILTISIITALAVVRPAYQAINHLNQTMEQIETLQR